MTAAKSAQPVHIRGLDPDIWKEMRLEAVRQGWPIATLIEKMWTAWQEQQSRPR